MKQAIILLFGFSITALFPACVKLVSYEDNEQEVRDSLRSSALGRVAEICEGWSEHYGCNSTCSMDLKNEKDIFTVVLSGGDNLLRVPPEVTASKVAFSSYLFFRDSVGFGHDRYRTAVVPEIGADTTTMEFEQGELALLESKLRICGDLLDLLEERVYDRMSRYLHPAYFGDTAVATMQRSFMQLEQEYGPLISRQLMGFSAPKVSMVNGKEMALFKVHIVIQRERQAYNLAFIMNSDQTDNQIYGLD